MEGYKKVCIQDEIKQKLTKSIKILKKINNFYIKKLNSNCQNHPQKQLKCKKRRQKYKKNYNPKTHAQLKF